MPLPSSSRISRSQQRLEDRHECCRMKVTGPLDEPGMDQGSSGTLGHVQAEWIWRLIHNRYTCVIPTWCQREFIELRDIPETLTSRTRASINPFSRSSDY
ncbi:unnamed protein product [Lasius platythorax]|uniref:Uncharacterized protein n=1 Tax=Lasius platythorax TaxID=488582 RepID=A0AAV2NK45_9HYME